MWVVVRYDAFEPLSADNPLVGIFKDQKKALLALLNVSIENITIAVTKKTPIEEVALYASYKVEPEIEHSIDSRVEYMDSYEIVKLKDAAKNLFTDTLELEHALKKIKKLKSLQNILDELN